MLVELRLKKIRLKQQKRLNKSNLYLYKSITLYIQSSDLRGIEKEEILQQVIDMMLQAQIENKSMNMIVGDDYEEFCKSIIEEYSENKSKVYMVLNYIQRYLFWTLLISIPILVLREIPIESLANMGITVDQFIMANLIALIILPASKKNRQETSSIQSLPQRLDMMSRNRYWSKAVFFMMFILIFKLFFFSEMMGSGISDYIITLLEAAPYIVLVFLVIGTTEIYKRVYDKR